MQRFCGICATQQKKVEKVWTSKKRVEKGGEDYKEEVEQNKIFCSDFVLLQRKKKLFEYFLFVCLFVLTAIQYLPRYRWNIFFEVRSQKKVSPIVFFAMKAAKNNDMLHPTSVGCSSYLSSPPPFNLLANEEEQKSKMMIFAILKLIHLSLSLSLYYHHLSLSH